MKKGFKTGCSVAAALVLATIVVAAAIDKWHCAPTQSIRFLNTGDATKSVTFEKVGKDGKLSGTYFVNDEIKPNESFMDKVPEGRYKIKVWNADESLYKSVDFEIAPKDPKASHCQLYRFDLAMDKIFAVVNLNALYESNSLADYMSDAVGAKREKLHIEKLYDANAPFLVPEAYTFRTFVDLEDKIPAKAKYGEVVYGLFVVSKPSDENQLQASIFKQIADKM